MLRLDFRIPPANFSPVSVAELQKTIRGMSAEDRKALAVIATRMKQRHTPARRRKLRAAMRAMDAGEKFTWMRSDKDGADQNSSCRVTSVARVFRGSRRSCTSASTEVICRSV